MPGNGQVLVKYVFLDPSHIKYWLRKIKCVREVYYRLNFEPRYCYWSDTINTENQILPGVN